MERSVYNSREWRNLPRDYCAVSHLLGDTAGPCTGLIHHHHVDPTDPDSRTIQVCNSHHQRIHTVLRHLSSERPVRRCTHNHRYEHARRECERRLNGLDQAAA
jgi:hypothetical protein